MSPTDDLVHAIDARLIAAQEQIEQLESARTALRAIQRTAPAATARSSRGDAAAGRPATRRRATRARTGRRATKSVGVDQIETTLAASGDGLSAASVADQLGGDRPRVLALLRELESSGQVRRTGARRTTRWHLVTDEDRVAQRAAELAALN